jgi:hypothetical protein
VGLAGRARDELLSFLRARGSRRAWLRVFADNRRARRFYERRGWVPTGERSRSTFAPYPTLLNYHVALGPARLPMKRTTQQPMTRIREALAFLFDGLVVLECDFDLTEH